MATEVQYTEHTTITAMLPLLTIVVVVVVVVVVAAAVVVVIVVKGHLHIACPTGEKELKERVVIPERRTN